MKKASHDALRTGDTAMVSCNQPQWTLGPISLAGFNAIFSIGGALLVFWTLKRRKA